MKRIALVLALALVFPAAAAAKGPAAGSVTGPGLDRPLELTGPGEPGSVGTLGRVVEYSGFFAALTGRAKFGDVPPSDDLGPRYTVVFTMRGDGTEKLRQHLYPYAQPFPVTYTPPGQRLYRREVASGWGAADPRLLDTLVEAGLPPGPPTATTDDGFQVPQPALLAPLPAVLALVLGAVLMRRRVATAR